MNSYIPAGFETTIKIVQNSTEDGYYIEPYKVNNILRANTKGVMSSFGSTVMGNNKYESSYKKFIEMLKSLQELDYCKGIPWYIDSGGFQVLTGSLTKDQIVILQDYYYRFLVDHKDLYSKGFILDLPVNNFCFSNWKELYDWNIKSYIQAVELPSYVRDKIIYIHHFTSPQVNKIFNRIMDEVDALNNFKYFGVGGIAKGISTNRHYTQIFTIPIIQFINKVKSKGINGLKLHFLGFNTPESVLFYKICEVICKKVHNVDLEITYDSAIYRKLATGRIFQVFEDNVISKVIFNGNKLHLKDTNNYIRNTLNKFAVRNGLEEIREDDFSVYNKTNSKRMHMTTYAYMLLYHIEYMQRVDQWLEKQGELLYYCFKDQGYDEFRNLMYDVSAKMSGGRYKRHQKLFANNFLKTIEMLVRCDQDEADYLLSNTPGTQNIFNEGVLTI